jgi:Mlc titration factor MtfA (ptsG expression regulator)
MGIAAFILFVIVAVRLYGKRGNYNMAGAYSFTEQKIVYPFAQKPGYIVFKNNYSMKALDQFLNDKIPYYRILSPQERHKFCIRLRRMLRNKFFIGRKGMQVTDEMMLTVGALMVQITFGYKDFSFPHFSRIAIYPDVFYSRLFERYLKGLTVYHTGVILISWPDAEKGVQIENDKVNLLLHELAHALFLDYFDKNSSDKEFGRWISKAMPHFLKMKNAVSEHYLREYASTNIQEFWAVAVEHYFEDAIQFSEEIPDLYREMCLILNQNLAQRLKMADAENKKRRAG